jgi:hypothetical protein
MLKNYIFKNIFKFFFWITFALISQLINQYVGFLKTHKIEIAVTISLVGVATYGVIRDRNSRKNQRALEAANPKRTEALETPL